MITEILHCVYLPHCILEPNQCNVEKNNKHRIGWLKVDRQNNKNGDCSLQELDLLLPRTLSTMLVYCLV